MSDIKRSDSRGSVFSFSDLIAIIPDLDICRISDNIPAISNHPWIKLPKILDMRKNTKTSPPISTSWLVFCGFAKYWQCNTHGTKIHITFFKEDSMSTSEEADFMNESPVIIDSFFT